MPAGCGRRWNLPFWQSNLERPYLPSDDCDHAHRFADFYWLVPRLYGTPVYSLGPLAEGPSLTGKPRAVAG